MTQSLAIVLRECLAIFETMRKLGFASDDIYFAMQPGPRKSTEILMVLRAQGLEFGAVAGYVNERSRETITEEWCRRAAEWNALPGTEAQRRWNESEARKGAVEMIAAMVAKGLVMPRRAAEVLS